MLDIFNHKWRHDILNKVIMKLSLISNTTLTDLVIVKTKSHVREINRH